MGLPRPVGPHAEEMLGPEAWPDVDEDAFYDRAREQVRDLQQVTEVLGTCRYEHAEVFGGRAWSGTAARAASSELESNITQLTTVQGSLARLIAWQQRVASMITQLKSDIADNVEATEVQITLVEDDFLLDPAERDAAITALVSAARAANIGMVSATADSILESHSWAPADSTVQDLLDRATSSPYTPEPLNQRSPSPAPTTWQVRETPPNDQVRETPPNDVVELQPEITETPQVTRPPTEPEAGAGPQTGPGMLSAQPLSLTASSLGQLTTPAPDVPRNAPGIGLSSSGPPGQPLGAATPGQARVTAASTAASTELNSRHGHDMTSPAPSAGSAQPSLPASTGALDGAAAGPLMSPVAPIGPKTTNNHPTKKASAATSSATSPGQASRRDSDDQSASDSAGAAAGIPVSPARAQRDAIADAFAGDAARQQGSKDPLRFGRRIAAALNAGNSGGQEDFGFFWITGVTSDGRIVVANSYGLAYIPEQVQLPEQVIMASADSSVPIAERARWATYPVTAVQGWAGHHDTELRAVIGTPEQLANCDAGAAKIALQPDDIPDCGDMPGRSRLAVVDAPMAARLASTPDSYLSNLLPLPPLDQPLLPVTPQQSPTAAETEAAEQMAKALADGTLSLQQLLDMAPTASDEERPGDEGAALWFELMKTMTSSAAARQEAHLRAFHDYAAHAQQVSLAHAHIAQDADLRRAAIADWMYWRYLTAQLGVAEISSRQAASQGAV